MSGKMEIPLYRHNLINEDLRALGDKFSDLLASMIISTGSVNAEVSNQFAQYLKRKHCLLTSSWTGGMLATLLALGIKPGDEIIIPALTFAATANVIEVLGAKPVLVDIDPATKLMDFEKVLEAITDKTRAVMPVHLYGQMIDVKTLRAMLPDSILIVEDAAHAIESNFANDRPGTYSSAAVFSFYQSKNMTTGEGGAIVTDDEELYKKIRLTYRHGVDLCGYQRHIREEFIAPDVLTAGIKANMPDILAILLPPQIEKAEENLAKRHALANRYLQELENLVEFPHVNPNATHAWHIFSIGVDPAIREKVLIDLYKNGIKTTVHFKAMHLTNYYKNRYNYSNEDYPHAYAWGESVISLPVFPNLRYDEQDYVIKVLKNILQ